MRAAWLALGASCVLLASAGADEGVEKHRVATVSRAEIEQGIISQITWDHGTMVLQGAIADARGQLSARYFLVAEKGVTLVPLAAPTTQMLEYWQRKSNRVSPTGLGTIVSASDSKMALSSLQGLEGALGQANDMGGMQVTHLLRLGPLVMLTRPGVAPYDGETYSWSPPELNRIVYVDGKGDVWIARADGRHAVRVLRGNYTLPAWSDDGASIAIAERKDSGRMWEISLLYLPSGLRTP
jgi:hypothetical protein